MFCRVLVDNPPRSLEVRILPNEDREYYHGKTFHTIQSLLEPPSILRNIPHFDVRELEQMYWPRNFKYRGRTIPLDVPNSFKSDFTAQIQRSSHFTFVFKMYENLVEYA